MPKPIKEQSKEEVATEVTEQQVDALEQYKIGEVSAVHLAVGVDLLGAKTSLVSGRGNELFAYTFGIVAKSGRDGRKVLIFASNIKAAVLK